MKDKTGGLYPAGPRADFLERLVSVERSYVVIEERYEPFDKYHPNRGPLP